MPATSLYDRTIKMTGASRGLRQDMSKRPIYLVRGRDRAGDDFECCQDRPFAVGVAQSHRYLTSLGLPVPVLIDHASVERCASEAEALLNEVHAWSSKTHLNFLMA